MERTVANKVHTQHGLLKSQLSSALRAIDDGSLADPTTRLERLTRSLESHLTLEEDHYFPQKRSDEPGLGDAIDELLLDHDDLRLFLRDAAEKLAAGESNAAKNALNRYGAKFQKHEKRESDLFEDPAHE